jgi:hypothetical protein
MKCNIFQKKKGKKCVNRFNPFVKSKSKKSYNPFKMWGSWIGAIIFPILLFNLFIKSNCQSPNCWQLQILEIMGLGSSFGLVVVLSIILGFLLGWGINSLWRKLR